MDGHGSHLNMAFIKRARDLRIMLAIYPPHSTHRLQPLDVSMFSPLATYYSQGVNDLLTRTIGYSTIKKPDFFPIFWEAYQKSFTVKNIESAWRKTGIWPHDPRIVLDQLPQAPKAPNSPRPPRIYTSSSPPDEFSTPRRVNKFRRYLDVVSARLDRRTSKLLKSVTARMERSHAELAVARTDIENLKLSLTREKKQKARRKKVLEQVRSDNGTGALWIDAELIEQAMQIEASREQENQQQVADKLARKEAQEQRKAEAVLEAEQKRHERAVASAAKQTAELARKAAVAEAKLTRAAAKEALLALKAAKKVSRAAPAKKIVARKPMLKPARPATPEPLIEAKTRTGRAVRPSARVRASN